ncbi:enoyl-CoA hydratase/isomerase family protein [Rubrimonas cliftonensis]|uniref:3-hydroxyisobutyryl-CoA hydrolase n=1 Tax=Rubrimonas cliftonensis TaxID=89524 RepID=A0A1H3VLM2_9RHOB|nr:enoyl-CoA hydratase/isomerase family protein [Rubrimonas cliftonensis]SDZ75703.1 3-hydroxyisobutyryl-CoA hydrolase [Rubrimonas cliftonensis]
MDDIIFERRGGLGLVTLNRPKALNALTHAMALALDARLRDWRDDAGVQAVAIVGAGERAFCAGGDVRALWEAGRGDPARDGARNWRFYADEYRLNALIHRYQKPYVAFMDGIVMGGGVGVSIHGARRVSGDATLFAMPETGIGLFPDVGATWFLPRLPGETGMWLGLTGARLKAADAGAAGLCDLHVPSAAQAAAVEALAAADLSAGLAAVDAALAPFAADPGPANLPRLRADIDRLFSGGGVEAVLAALDGDGGEWAAEQAAAIRAKSPSSTRIAFRQLREGRALDFAACMALEYRLARFCMVSPDFYEGVRAVVIDKDAAPRWRPSALAEADDAHVAGAFAPAPAGEELALD